MTAWTRLAAAPLLAALALADCAGPAPDPAAQLLGAYQATSTVTISIDGGPTLPPTSMDAPLLVVRGASADIVLDDGMCLLPATVMGMGSDLLWHFRLVGESHCTRYQDGAEISVNFTAGDGTVDSGGTLAMTATGMFTFVPLGDGGAVAPDGGMASPGRGMVTVGFAGHRL